MLTFSFSLEARAAQPCTSAGPCAGELSDGKGPRGQCRSLISVPSDPSLGDFIMSFPESHVAEGTVIGDCILLKGQAEFSLLLRFTRSQ